MTTVDLTADAELVRRPHRAESRVSGAQWQFGNVLISDVLLQPGQSDDRLRADLLPPRSDVNLVFVLEGAVQVQLDGGTFVFVAGAGIVLPSNELPAFTCTTAGRVLVVSLADHSRRLRETVPERPTAIAAAVIETHPTLGFLLALVDTARRHPIKTPPAGSIIVKLCAALLDADQDWHTRPHDAQVAEILELIDKRHSDQAFDIKAVARHLRVTPRDVSAVLEHRHGGRQVDDILLERRLVAAMTLLHPGKSRASAEQIAARSGFPSVTFLDSALGGVYGLDTGTLLEIR
jgi:AraC-like DNA-binding protein